MKSRYTRLPVIGVMSLLSLQSLTFAADEWTITDAQFQSTTSTLTQWRDESISARGADGKSVELPLANLVQLSRAIKIESPRGLTLVSADGQRLPGKPVRLDGQMIVWAVQSVGELRVPLENALGIVATADASDQLSIKRSEDEIRLANGDQVNGIVTGVSATAITITPTGQPAIDVPVDSIRELYFATPPQGRSEVALSKYVIRTINGAVIAADKIGIDGEKLTIQTKSGDSASFPQPSIAVIEHADGPVTWLSNRLTAESIYTPFFEGSFTPQMDLTVVREPIRFGGILYQHGIGVHSHTRLTWPIKPGDKQFRTRYAVDPDMRYADVDVRVLLDGKPVHEARGIKAGVLSQVIEADIGTAKTLTLEVDYGQGYDVQDRLNWIEPAIIRGK